jgi:hypothetical protein
MNGKQPYTPFKQVIGGSFYKNRSRGQAETEKDLQKEQLRIRRMMDDASRYNKPIDPRTQLYGQLIGATGGGGTVYRPEEAMSLIKEYENEIFPKDRRSGNLSPRSWSWWSQTPQYQFPMMR